MNTEESFSNLTYAEEMHKAESELSAFISAVTQLCGPEQARLATEDWLDESALMDSPPRSTSRDWRTVTIAASARLASQLSIALHHHMPCHSVDDPSRHISELADVPNVMASGLLLSAIFV